MASGHKVGSAKVTTKAHAKLGTSSVNMLGLEQSVRTGQEVSNVLRECMATGDGG